MPNELAHVDKWLNHMEWANQRAIDALVQSRGCPDRGLQILAHVLGAEELWLARMLDRPPVVPLWPELTLDACRALAASTITGYRRFIRDLGHPGLEQDVTYRNSAGQEFTSPARDIVAHVALHGSYHRGQIALLLRSAGFEPNPTDYIAFVRGAPSATRKRGEG